MKISDNALKATQKIDELLCTDVFDKINNTIAVTIFVVIP